MAARKTLTARVSAFVRASEERSLAVFKQSAQDVMREASKPKAQGGNMPVDTGFLRNSLTHEVDGTPVAKGADAYVLAIAGMKLGQVYTGTWTAAYAMAVHYGSRGRAPALFAALAAQRWPEFVRTNARKLEQRIRGRT